MMNTSGNIIRTYSELIKMNTFKDRVQYLKLDGVVGETTYGFDRWINQMFYKSKEWRQIRTDRWSAAAYNTLSCLCLYEQGQQWFYE